MCNGKLVLSVYFILCHLLCFLCYCVIKCVVNTLNILCWNAVKKLFWIFFCFIFILNLQKLTSVWFVKYFFCYCLFIILFVQPQKQKQYFLKTFSFFPALRSLFVILAFAERWPTLCHSAHHGNKLKAPRLRISIVSCEWDILFMAWLLFPLTWSAEQWGVKSFSTINTCSRYTNK